MVLQKSIVLNKDYSFPFHTSLCLKHIGKQNLKNKNMQNKNYFINLDFLWVRRKIFIPKNTKQTQNKVKQSPRIQISIMFNQILGWNLTLERTKVTRQVGLSPHAVNEWMLVTTVPSACVTVSYYGWGLHSAHHKVYSIHDNSIACMTVPDSLHLLCLGYACEKVDGPCC